MSTTNSQTSQAATLTPAMAVTTLPTGSKSPLFEAGMSGLVSKALLDVSRDAHDGCKSYG